MIIKKYKKSVDAHLSLALLACLLSFSLCALISGSKSPSSVSSALEQLHVILTRVHKRIEQKTNFSVTIENEIASNPHREEKNQKTSNRKNVMHTLRLYECFNFVYYYCKCNTGPYSLCFCKKIIKHTVILGNITQELLQFSAKFSTANVTLHFILFFLFFKSFT